MRKKPPSRFPRFGRTVACIALLVFTSISCGGGSNGENKGSNGDDGGGAGSGTGGGSYQFHPDDLIGRWTGITTGLDSTCPTPHIAEFYPGTFPFSPGTLLLDEGGMDSNGRFYHYSINEGTFHFSIPCTATWSGPASCNIDRFELRNAGHGNSSERLSAYWNFEDQLLVITIFHSGVWRIVDTFTNVFGDGYLHLQYSWNEINKELIFEEGLGRFIGNGKENELAWGEAIFLEGDFKKIVDG